MVGGSLPRYVHPSIFPGTPSQPGPPCRTHRTGQHRGRGPAALTRAVAELTVRNGRVTVSSVTDDPFHCWLLFGWRIRVCKVPCFFGRGTLLRRQGLIPPSPVSLLGNTSYVPNYQLLVKKEGIRRPGVGVRSPC